MLRTLPGRHPHLDTRPGLSLLPAALLIVCACERSPEPAAPTTSNGQAAQDQETLKLVRRRNIGLAYLEAERHADAAAVFDELIQLIPEEPMVHANRGLIGLREGKLDQAKTHLETAGRLAPDDPSIALLRSVAAVYEGHDDLARTLLEHAVQKNPDQVRARWALVEVLKRSRSDAAAETLLTHLDTLLEYAPANVVVRLALARHLLEQGELEQASGHLAVLDDLGIASSPQARQLLEQSRDRVAQGDAASARSLVIALDNVLKPSRPWQDSLAEVRGPPVPVAEPIWSFLAYPVPEPQIGPRMLEVEYRDVGEALGLREMEAESATMVAGVAGHPWILAVLGPNAEIHEPNTQGRYQATRRLSLEPQRRGSGAAVSRILVCDWNNDRRMDLVFGLTDGTVRLRARGEGASWQAVTGESILAPLDEPSVFHVLTPWDADQDGDLDILVGRSGTAPALLRNNGDGTFAETAHGLGIAGPALIDAATADLDEDGDLDLVAVDAKQRLIRFDNLRSGRYVRAELGIAPGPVLCLAAADFDNDGWVDLVFVTSDGCCFIAGNRRGTAFDLRRVGGLERADDPTTTIRHLDFDNDGWLDLLVVAGGRAHLFRNTGGLTFSRMRSALPSEAAGVKDVQVVDHDSDGDLDLFVTLDGDRCTIWNNEGGNRHAWQKVRLEAIVEGGQRNNSFGIGGFIESRAGKAYQKRLVHGPVTHFGLGAFGPADALRVVWPNGVPQNILEPEPNQLIVEKQTLKGSCPFLLADNGRRLEFVTDLLWRSPLGMKINAQTVAPIGSTQDYVRIEARQLRPRRGRYELAITAALWEAIFLDRVELWAVDHPPSLEIFVDERFVAPVFPPFQIHVVDGLRTPVSAVDDRGRDVLDLVAARDGRRLGGFASGRYQGITRMHHVEIDLGPWPEPRAVRLIASGWIMPTNSSINVAVSQGDHPAPAPLSVSLADGAGGWIEVLPNAGFPAGKLKTIVLELCEQFPTADHRIRLATNLEIYWDRIAFTLGRPAFEARPDPLVMARADLQFLGFPTMSRRDEHAPELPDYVNPSRQMRWRDLHGYYTRYGDVRELLAETDDRYVIMNAGDEIRLSFEAGSPPPQGWKRDFILFTDGWVKDGDWNTAASMTVRPLPHHRMKRYPHPDDLFKPGHPDWQDYHTRFVDSKPFRDRMRPRH